MLRSVRTQVQAQLPTAKDHVIRGNGADTRNAGRVKTRAPRWMESARVGRGDCTKFAIVVVVVVDGDGDDRADVREAAIIAVARARLYWRRRVRSRDAARRADGNGGSRFRRCAWIRTLRATRDARRMRPCAATSRDQPRPRPRPIIGPSALTRRSRA